MADTRSSGQHSSNDHDVKRQKHKRKMTKIMGKIWTFPGAEKFHQSKGLSSSSRPLDLESVGQNLDDGVYQHGRKGWENFALDVGAVFNTHIERRTKYTSAAKENLKHALKLFEKIDESLVVKASEASPIIDHNMKHDKIEAKKRKKSNESDTLMNTHVPKKRNTREGNASTSKTLTLSQREKNAMNELALYVEECGGDRQQVLSFHVTISHRGSNNKNEIAYYSPQGHRYKKKADVVRFLGLTALSNNKSNSKINNRNQTVKTINSGKPRNARDCENERKRLKKEIDKLLKAHGKASKSLDDLRNEHSKDMNPIDDKVLMEQNEAAGLDVSKKNARIPDIEGFPGMPSYCAGDILMVWDFLCTFFRVLSLEPISLDDFASALMYMPQKTKEEFGSQGIQAGSNEDKTSIPVYLAEAHLALLKLLLTDPSSDDWWWSTLESDVTNVDEDIISESTSKMSDASAPIIKVDMAELLFVEEDPILTTRWLQALEDVRVRKTNSGGPIKSAVKSAASITSNPLVKMYLQKAMRKWKGNAAGFTKRAVVWLIDRVREARPDLWGKKVSKDAVNEQTSRVAREAAAVMDLFEEDAEINNENESNLDEASDDEDESDDEDDEDGEDYVDDEEEIQNKKSIAFARRVNKNENAPVTSAVPIKPPPTIVDLLLPPAKPTFSSDIVTPHTWPALVGASVCRIYHRYKRQRNEVDDELREFHSLPPLSIGERVKREKRASKRIFSECANHDLSQSEDFILGLEEAIDHLCCGGSYLDLIPIQRLCLLRALIEAVYDTHKVTKAIEENFRSRINAVKSLETEEKRAKREAREEASAADRAARKRLADDKRKMFISKKRNEIVRLNKNSNNYTPESVENIADEDVIEYDDETKKAYDSLPKPESFNKTEVNAMVAKLNEESAFESDSVLVLTIDEIKAREEEYLESLEDRLKSYGDIDSLFENGNVDRETSAKVEKLKREIWNLKESFLELPDKRTEAVDMLNDAIEEGTVKELKNAIKTAKLAQLFGLEDSTGGVWALDILRDAALELKVSERCRRVTDAQKDLLAKRNKCFIRTNPLGQDRYRNKFWHFDNDRYGRVWTETDFSIVQSESHAIERKLVAEDSKMCVQIDRAVIGCMDEESDFCIAQSSDFPGINRAIFGRKEYHPSGLLAGLPKRNWGGHITEKSLRSLMKDCDQRGIREASLKAKLKEMLDAKGQSLMDTSLDKKDEKIHSNEIEKESSQDTSSKNLLYQSFGDDDDFRASIQAAKCKGFSVSHVESKRTAIGERIRYRSKIESLSNEELYQYTMGTVVGWSPRNMHIGITETEKNGDEMLSTWRILLDSGIDIDISGVDVVMGLTRAYFWSSNKKEYVENDAVFLNYRNTLGRFCGRQIDAPFSASPYFFAKQMVKRETEFYTPLKNRGCWNEWGGRSAARNAWLSKMKDPDVNFFFVRDGLLTLETVFFQMTGGFESLPVTTHGTNVPESSPNGKELLDDKKYRFDIELESITGTPKSLWNSRETRAIFQEIIQSCSSIGILALGLDLMSRNCRLYLKANKSTQQAFESHINSTRRQNLWQQKQNESYY